MTKYSDREFLQEISMNNNTREIEVVLDLCIFNSNNSNQIKDFSNNNTF
jgi:hypothetical protein